MTRTIRMISSGLVGTLVLATALGARSADVLDQSFVVQPGGTLTVTAAMGSIEVTSGASDRVQVRIFREADLDEAEFEARLREFDFQLRQFGNDVEVRVERIGNRNSWSRSKQLRFRFQIEVPFRYDLNLTTAGGSIGVADLDGEVDAKTAGGSLSFGQIGGRVRGVTAGGSIELESATADAELRTAGGSIRVGRVSGSVDAKTSGGSIEVEEVQGDIQAATSGGNVKARISAQPIGECRLSTSGGNVTVELAEGIALEVDAVTSSGRVIHDLPLSAESDPRKRNRLQASLGSGGPRLVLRTSGGNIELRRLQR